MPDSIWKKLYPDSELATPKKTVSVQDLPPGTVMVRLAEDAGFIVEGNPDDPKAIRCAMELSDSLTDYAHGINKQERKFDA